ncbi:MAG TPA: acyl-CoA synthetase [Frankiaceae bacterium]|nr:acyl-CoA synthetase [Frankiaceae bacterium]
MSTTSPPLEAATSTEGRPAEGRSAEAPSGQLWPHYAGPTDLDHVESVPLDARALPQSTYAALRASALNAPERTALAVLPDGERWDAPVEVTYGELLREVTRTANALTSSGVGRRDAVGLLSPNVKQMVPALLAAQASGIVAPVNPGLGVDEVTELLRRAGAKVLIAAGPEVSPEVWALARQVVASRRLDALLALRPTLPGADPAPVLEPIVGVTVRYLDEAAAGHVDDRLLAGEPTSDDLAAFFHTGGTTGMPKLAAHTHRMEIADAWGVAAGAPMSRDATVFAALPLFHVNALIVTTLAPILRGARSVWAGPLGYRDTGLMRSFWRVIDRYQVTVMSAVPSVYANLSRLPVDADISSLRLPLVGAAPLPRSVRDAWLASTGVPLCEGYGLTEATCASTRSFSEHLRPDSVGQRLPYQQVCAIEIDETTGERTFLPPETIGTIAIAGPTVFPGYVVGRTPEGPVLDSGGKVLDGWLDTGDLGSVSSDGFVTISGRAKDVIIRGGHNIDPAVVETVLRQHPAVVDASVVARPDRYAGEVPVAFVVVHGDERANSHPDALTGELLRWSGEHVPERASVPKDITILAALPYTAVGKPYKVDLRVRAARQELTEKLAQIGYAVPPGDGWCVQRDGRLVVTLPKPTDIEQQPAVARLLDGYAISWSFQ